MLLGHKMCQGHYLSLKKKDKKNSSAINTFFNRYRFKKALPLII